MQLRKQYGSIDELFRKPPESLADSGNRSESLADPVKGPVDPNYIENLAAAIKKYDPDGSKALALARKYGNF